ncbi:MAG: hypothetical protein E7289_06370 [Lachnospiraceae bacterium]|nr:hypothetical protein [Lachnospiraceae bacterium]
MKCPYCGAEVTPNTKCEYCDSFVERKSTEESAKNEYHEHIENIIHETAEQIEDTMKQISSPENKRILRNVLIGIVIACIVMAICFFIFIASSFRYSFQILDSMYGNDTEDYFYSVDDNATATKDISNLTDAEGVVSYFNTDGTIGIEYEGEECDTSLTDETLLNWLNKHGHSLNTVGVLFTTDADGNVTSLAMSSHTFYVLEKQDDTYLLLRGEDVFRATSDVPLEQGCYYGGYMNYPALNVHTAFSERETGYSKFDPVCEQKEMRTFTDPYTEEELTLPMICVGDDWYYCSQEIYDACTEQEIIPVDVTFDSSMGIVLTEDN